MRLVVLPGDGIGPENAAVTVAARGCFKLGTRETGEPLAAGLRKN